MTIPQLTALVPMKHHSERVSGKNYRPFCGKPLFHWVLTALNESKHVGPIIVNTDSERIADEVIKFGAIVLERPEHLRGDMITIEPLIKWDLAHSSGEYYLQTHSTNPLLTPDTLDRAVEQFFSHPENDSLFSVTPMRTRFYWPDGRPVNHDPKHLTRTQDLPPIYEENSCIYVFSRSAFEKTGHRTGERPLMFEMHSLEAVDIDDEQDFEIAELTMRARLAGARS